MGMAGDIQCGQCRGREGWRVSGLGDWRGGNWAGQWVWWAFVWAGGWLAIRGGAGGGVASGCGWGG